MLFTYAFLLSVVVSNLAHAYDVDADLARGLVHNNLTITGSGSFSDFPEDCAAVYLNAKMLNQNVSSGLYEIWPRLGKPFVVLCDMETDGGGWTVFQKRDDLIPGENFYRTWLEYKRGFGELDKEFWLGNDRLSLLTNQDEYELRVDLEDFDEQQRFAHYYSFRIATELDKYRLTLGKYIDGDAGDSLSTHDGRLFSTKDQDNDASSFQSCAQGYHGAWWYHYCHASNLNGDYLRGYHPTTSGQGVNWRSFRDYDYSLKRTEMKIRPVWFKP